MPERINLDYLSPDKRISVPNKSPRTVLEIYNAERQPLGRTLLVLAGYGAGARTMRLVSNTAALRGFNVICPEIIIGREPRSSGLFPDVDLAKQLAIQDAIDYAKDLWGTGKYDAIVHSKAGIDIAKFHPQNLLLVASGGIHPGVPSWKMLGKLMITGFLQNQHDKKNLAKEGNELTRSLLLQSKEDDRYLKWSNTVRIIRENWTSATANILPDLRELMFEGGNVALIAMEDDAWFKPGIYRPKELDSKIKFVTLSGTHGQFKVVSETCGKVIDILEELVRANS